ncbi:heterokaryon incompatibility protein-domain-containing protein, partial [Immersiella caudata]
IRVLDLQPSLSESRDDPIRGRLRVVHLTEDPGFVALSYVWGRPSRSPRAVYCNDIPISVTKNCWDALWHLRDPILGRGRARNTDGSITLWIDSICINQSDKTEKDSQIPLMNDIYSGARSVCVWL